MKTLMRGLVKGVLLEDDFKRQEYNDTSYLTGCKSLYKNRLLKYILQKHKRNVIMKLTKTNVTNMTKEEDAFYRGSLYMIRTIETTIRNGNSDFESLEKFEEYFD